MELTNEAPQVSNQSCAVPCVDACSLKSCWYPLCLNRMSEGTPHIDGTYDLYPLPPRLCQQLPVLAGAVPARISLVWEALFIRTPGVDVHTAARSQPRLAAAAPQVGEGMLQQSLCRY